MRYLRSLLGLVLLSGAFFAREARADTVTANVLKIVVGWDGGVDVTFDKIVTSLSCASTYRTNFTFNASTDQGRALLSVFLAAKLSSTPVIVSGRGVCTTPATEEQLAWVQLQ